MKIGILTHPLENNYGGLLQNFALQTILEYFGHDVRTVDLHPLAKVSLIRKFAGWINRLFLYYIRGLKVPISFNPLPSHNQFNMISQHTQSFVRANIKCTRRIETFRDLCEIDKEYLFDVYVIGSDQVWNPGFCPWFFGSFISRNSVECISFAASFGFSDWKLSNELTKKCTLLVKKFKAVSVREDSAVDLCKQYFGINAVHVIDPTMLLTKDDYLKHIEINIEEGSLFSYLLDKCTKKEEIVYFIAKQKKLKIKTCMPKEQFVRGVSNIEDCVFPPIDNWLNGFNNAKFVITDSFHGTVFAILFNKPFVTIGNKRRGLARFESLLRMFSLEDRLVTSLEEVKNILNKPINYVQVNQKLEFERNKALNFLSISV